MLRSRGTLRTGVNILVARTTGIRGCARPADAARFVRCALCPLLALCPALVATRLAAQKPEATDDAQVSGVAHTASGAPARGLTVELLGTPYAATTTDSGTFRLTRVTPGAYVVVAHGTGWVTTRSRITATAGQETRLTLVVASAGASGAVALPAVTVAGQAASRAPSGPTVSAAGSNDYALSAQAIQNLPEGDATTVTDVLAQMPGVAIDQNQQIHLRNTEGPQFQYSIDGAVVPLDINTNPPFVSMLNPMFVSRLDLLDGVLPAQFSYATGGIVDIAAKNGCDAPRGSMSALFGQRRTFEPSVQYAGCAGRVSYYVSGLYDQGETAFSSATPGPNPIHNQTNGGQTFGYVSVPLNAGTKLSAVVSSEASNNQLPNVAGLSPQFELAGAPDLSSAAIGSYLNFRDYLGMITLKGMATGALGYQITYAVHSISQRFVPDQTGELIFQGVASTASHNDFDNTLQGDLTYTGGRHVVTSGVYAGEYHVAANDRSLVFPVDSNGDQASSTPLTVVNNTRATNLLLGVYVNDLWRVTERLTLNLGLRFDDITGFTNSSQLNPTANVMYAVSSHTTVHAGVARYLEVPSFQGISPAASAVFAATTAGGPPGISTPLTEDDVEWDVGIVASLSPRITVSQDNYYELTHRYLDTGQFGVVPIFAPFNYGQGTIRGSELAVAYRDDKLSAYTNVTIGNNLQKGVVTGQFNFPADELAYIDHHYIVLDHQPLYGAAAGASYTVQQFAFSLDGVYSSGLRGGFADLERLPTVVQINASAQRSFRVPGLGSVTNRLTVLNLLDRVNMIRPSEGIGIFQSAYGPRFTLLDAVTIPIGH